jgi:hypothetical protein
MVRIWTDKHLIREPLGRAGFKDGADVVVLRRLPQKKKRMEKKRR